MLHFTFKHFSGQVSAMRDAIQLPRIFWHCSFPGKLIAAVCLTKFTFAFSSCQQQIWSATYTAPFAVFPRLPMWSDLQGLRPNPLMRAGSHMQNCSFFLEVLTIAFFQKIKVPNTHPSSQTRRLLFKIPWPHAPPGLALEAEVKHQPTALPWLLFHELMASAKGGWLHNLHTNAYLYSLQVRFTRRLPIIMVLFAKLI